MNQFSTEKQQLIIENLIGSTDLFSICSKIVRAEYFDPEFRSTVDFVQSYYNTYFTTPSNDIVTAETGVKLVERKALPKDQFEYTCDNIEQFCLQKAIINEVINARQLIADQNYGEVVERIQAAAGISLKRDLGIDVLDDVAERITNRSTAFQYYSTGWDNVDESLGGGTRPTELILLSANSGGGKSVGLSNLALSWVAQGVDVLYISLELQEDMIADRFETMVTGWNKTEKFSRIQETAQKVESLKSKSGASIYVKYMEADVTNSNDIRAYLKEFNLEHGKMPGALIVDYLDILGTNERKHYSNVFDKDKVVSTQLRSLGNNSHHPMLMASASQQNRSAIGETDLNQSHIAGGLSKVNTCDVYISIIMTDTMRQMGIAQFAFLKTRSSGAVGTRVDMKWDPIRLMFTSTSSSGLPIPSLESNRVSNTPFVPDNEFDDEYEQLFNNQ